MELVGRGGGDWDESFMGAGTADGDEWPLGRKSDSALRVASSSIDVGI